MKWVVGGRTGKVAMQWFLNPEGKMFRGRKSALDEIVNSGKYSKQEIRQEGFYLLNHKIL